MRREDQNTAVRHFGLEGANQRNAVDFGGAESEINEQYIRRRRAQAGDHHATAFVVADNPKIGLLQQFRNDPYPHDSVVIQNGYSNFRTNTSHDRSWAIYCLDRTSVV